MSLQLLRSFQADRMELEEMLALSMFARALKTEYAGHRLPVPAWLTEQSDKLSAAISTHRRDELQRQLKEVRLRKDQLKTAEERRTDLSKQEADLIAALGDA